MMALALGLVGQPVQPYLTTGATDYVDSVQKGKEDAAKLKQAETVNQKSALDLLMTQKKQKDAEYVSANAPAVLAKAKKMEMSDAEYAQMLQADPEFAKVLNTERADAAKNFITSNALYLNSSTDKAKTLQEIAQAHDAHNMPLPEQVRNNPDLLAQYYKTLISGAKAFDEKTVSTDESGNIIGKNLTGETVSIDRAPVKPEKTQKAPVTWTVPNGRKETTYGYDANGKQVVLGVKDLDKTEPSEDSTNSFTPEAIDNAAARYNIDGTLPPMGMGKGGSAARSQILNRAAELVSGVSGTDQRVNQLTTKASASTLLQLKKTKTMIKAFEEMANKNADIALEMSAKVDRSGTPVVNRWFLAANNKIAGDVDTATFNTALNVFANEYAKIMSGSMGNTPVSDSARKEAHEILNTAQTPAQLRANIKLLQREMKNRIIGLDESEHELIKQMKSAGVSTKKEDESKNSTSNQSAYQLYVQHWNNAKNNPALQKQLTDRAREMGIVK
jgi:hypothetical protein